MPETTKKGKIIAVVGAPAVGKSTLARKLGKFSKTQVFYEGDGGPEQFPEFIKTNLKEHVRPLQTNLFFQNLTVTQYLQAMEIVSYGKNILLDTFWLTNLFYSLPVIYTDPHDIELMNKLVSIAKKSYPAPDVILYMKAAPALIAARIAARGRDFEKEFLSKALHVNEAHAAYFESEKASQEFSKTKILCVNAHHYDLREIAQSVGLSFNS